VHGRQVRFFLRLTSVLINANALRGTYYFIVILLYYRDHVRLSPDNAMRYRKRRIFLSSVCACTDIAFRRTVVVFSAVAHFRSRRWHHGARLCLYVLYYNIIMRQVPSPSPAMAYRYILLFAELYSCMHIVCVKCVVCDTRRITNIITITSSPRTVITPRRACA